MRAKATVIAVMALVALCASIPVMGQNVRPATAERSVVIKAAEELMGKVRFCALVTVGHDGQPQARVVDPFAPGGDMTVWIATNPGTRKVDQIKKDSRVTCSTSTPLVQAT